MKKGILYAVTAVLLGVALILTPRLFLSISGAFLQPPIPQGGLFTTSEFKEAVIRNEAAVGVTPQHPSDEISVGLMSAFSLVLALLVFRQSKKRTV